MATKGNEPLQIPALGRPFALGLLYDADRDKLIPSLSLWTSDTLSKHVTEFECFSTNIDIDSSDSIEAKNNSMDLNANMKLSFLCDTLTVSGSGAYLKDNVSSKNQARVTMKFKQTTRTRQLSVDLMKTHKEGDNTITRGPLLPLLDLAKEVKATHIVTAITYGAEINLVFDTMCANEKEKTDIKGKLSANFKSYKVDISGKLTGSITETTESTKNKFDVKLFGDVCLDDTCPSNLEDAIRLYKRLPEIVRNKSVPVTIHLLPLSVLSPTFPKWEMRVIDDEMRTVNGIFQQLQDLEMKCNDLCNSPVATHVPQLKNKPKQIASHIKWYRSKLQQKLRLCYGSMEEEGITGKFSKLVDDHYRSPFTTILMEPLLEEIENEAIYIDSVIKSVAPAAVVAREVEIQSYLNGKLHVIGLDVVLYIEEIPFMNAMEKYLKTGSSKETYEFVSTDIYKNTHRRIQMRDCLKRFTAVAKANEHNESCTTVCYIKGVPNTTQVENFSNPQLKLFTGDFLIPEEFQEPPVPRNVSAIVRNDKVKVTWECDGHRGDFRVTFTAENNDDDNNGESELTSEPILEMELNAGKWHVAIHTVVDGCFGAPSERKSFKIEEKLPEVEYHNYLSYGTQVNAYVSAEKQQY